MNKTNITISSIVTVGSLLFSSVGQAVDIRPDDLYADDVLANFIIQGQELVAFSSRPWVTFNDWDSAGIEWSFSGYTDYFRLYDENTSSINPVLSINHSANNPHSLEIDTSGDINLANGSVFIDRSKKWMGIATATPESGLHIKNGSGNIMLEGVGQSGTYSKWQLATITNGDFAIVDPLNSDNFALQIKANTPDDSFSITPTGVGIGINEPQSKLDVLGQIQATWSGSGGGLKELFKMSSNNSNASAFSDTGFVMENKRAGFSWAFRTLEDVGGFAASKQGTGEKEFEIRNTTNAAANVKLFLANGARNVGGQWLNASSRSYKKNIHDLSSEDAMQALRGLKSVKYQLKRDMDNQQRVGFIAEDVPELLATKDRKTVDPLQIIAVLTKAVQEQDKLLLEQDSELLKIKAEVKTKNQKIAVMEAKINQFGMVQKRLAKVEELLTRLSSSSLDVSEKLAYIDFK